MEYNFNQIREILPHRYPFLLIDKIVEGEVGLWAKAIKNVSGNEEFFKGHFPNYPVMPGVLIIEAMAQTGAVALLTKEENIGKIALFTSIKNAKFRRQVFPGDRLEISCKLTRSLGQMGLGKAEAHVDGELVARAELGFFVQ